MQVLARWLAISLFTGKVVLAQSSVVDLHVEVFDISGAAVAARGFLEGVPAGLRRGFQCDARGAAHISVPPGEYRVRISKEGFATDTSTVQVKGPDAVTHRVTLAVGDGVYTVSVVSATPLAGLDRPLDEIPAPVQTAGTGGIDSAGAPDLSSLLNRRMNNVFLNEIQGNPMQADLNYRGFTASPLLGTPQGISVYLDGVRLNQPFGDVVSWDLIPRSVISEVALIPGSNPLFGLNTLGGALSVRTKDGVSHPGSSIRLGGGSFGRKTADLEQGGSAGRLDWFLASSLFFEDGWRETSPSNVRQFFGKLGSHRERTSVNLTLAYANNALIGNALQEERLLARDYRSVYTKPDVTVHRAPFGTLNLRRALTGSLTFSGNAYFRYIRTRALNGDINEDSLDQAVYQPNAAERAALAAAGYTGFPLAGETAANTPFPSWRCIANVLRRDEPGEKCNGLLNRFASWQRNYGLSGQATQFSRAGSFRNQLTVGAAYDGNGIGFTQSSELGYLNPDRSITGLGAFADGVTGGEVDGEPLDTRVNLSGWIHASSVYATDTVVLGNRWNLTFSGRFNHAILDNRDRIRPLAGTGSLTGRHSFNRFNPAAGATYKAAEALSFYGGYTEGNRAPTSIELGCADPAAPCKLPNAMAGDPPLVQVRARTFEAGARGQGRLRWSAGWFRAENRDDILFVASEQTGFGYFKNFGKTRRQGVELAVNGRAGRVTAGAGYTFLDATFQSPEEVNGAGNSTNEEARAGTPGGEGAIEIEPGNRIPLIPRQMVKAYADIQAASHLSLGFDVIGIGSSFARGNENNLHRPDGRYYLGKGTSPGYAVVNFGARYDVHRRVELYANVNNLFNRRYYSAAQLGATGFTPAGNFAARPYPAVNGEFPVQQSVFLAPGAPRAAWLGLRFRF